jgi:hypothetical protein
MGPLYSGVWGGENNNLTFRAGHVAVAGVCTQAPANRRMRSPRWEAVLAKFEFR